MTVSVKSEMAGVIVEITAEEGQKVEAEDEVLVLSSMKMEIPILAPQAGTVTEILVEEDEAVTAGAVLFVLD